MIIDFSDAKFRAWDSQRNKWVYFMLHELLYINTECLTDDQYAFMQLERVGRFTGFRDRNQKEIYEDDIVSMLDVRALDPSTKHFVVEWEFGAFVLRSLDDPDSVYLMHDFWPWIIEHAEVVGNRYELEEVRTENEKDEEKQAAKNSKPKFGLIIDIELEKLKLIADYFNIPLSVFQMSMDELTDFTIRHEPGDVTRIEGVMNTTNQTESKFEPTPGVFIHIELEKLKLISEHYDLPLAVFFMSIDELKGFIAREGSNKKERKKEIIRKLEQLKELLEG